MDDVRLVYHGYVFHASGYGRAARGYIHALNAAGVRLSVSDLGGGVPQVRDSLVTSLKDRFGDGDLHLFHGIPPQWARRAFRTQNAIGMTVWETDTMPTQWRNILTHVREVWLPCHFNIEAFRRNLATPLFRLPHVWLPPEENGNPNGAEFLGLDDRAFVVYSIFDWQDRKSPAETMEVFLRAFQDDPDAVLVLKSNPGAAEIGLRALNEVRQRVISKARIELRCEGWSDEQVDALHRRGDCYLSLHCGEGWCYPLFEAACRGIPVVATAYSGPMDYLTAEHHSLVPYRLRPVRQRYAYYHSRMQWAEPDVAEAERLLRNTRAGIDSARARAAIAAERLRREYSLESVGGLARDRLMDLLKRTLPERWRSIKAAQTAERLRPPQPIPGDWYDHDYFETGVKSNWTGGYRWPQFQRLFEEAAAYLEAIFPDAASFLDCGCAKGFLVRALRERRKEAFGFDASPWAIAHAEPGVSEFLTHAGVDDVQYGRTFDVLLAMDLLAHLTESQIDVFLARARAWTRLAMLAIIPGAEPEGADQDLSHITLRPAEWWHARFLAAGWRQDPFVRNFQRACQSHPLPVQMGWTMYVYAPGCGGG